MRKPLVYVAGPYTNPDPVENTHTAIQVGADSRVTLDGEREQQRADFRKSWEEFARLFDHAMNKPQVQAIPEVFDVLALLGEAIAHLAHDIDGLVLYGG